MGMGKALRGIEETCSLRGEVESETDSGQRKWGGKVESEGEFEPAFF